VARVTTVASVLDEPRLRQVALVARDGAAVAGQLAERFSWPEPFHDPGVGEFGLENSVFEAGDTFVEVVSPVTADTTAGRYLERRGGDGGYMAIFQVPDLRVARDRLVAVGARVVWSIELEDMATVHLHPKDVPGAIVSIDWADPPGSWRWAGPRWAGTVPDDAAAGGVSSITVAVPDPSVAAARWAEVLGIDALGDADGTATVPLIGSGQLVRFVRTDETPTITAVEIEGPWTPGTAEIGGVSFTSQEGP
jgi:hypothetical protein